MDQKSTQTIMKPRKSGEGSTLSSRNTWDASLGNRPSQGTTAIAGTSPLQPKSLSSSGSYSYNRSSINLTRPPTFIPKRKPPSKSKQYHQRRHLINILGTGHFTEHDRKLPYRIFREKLELQLSPIKGVEIKFDEDNIRHLCIRIDGPNSSPFVGGIFDVEILLPAAYPIVPPLVRFMTKIYHPNIDKMGRIALPIIKSKWSPKYDIRKVLESLQTLLGSPNIDDAVSLDVARRWMWNESTAIEMAKDWTRLYAMGGEPARIAAINEALI